MQRDIVDSQQRRAWRNAQWRVRARSQAELVEWHSASTSLTWLNGGGDSPLSGKTADVPAAPTCSRS
jgi:hypothetical protein